MTPSARRPLIAAAALLAVAGAAFALGANRNPERFEAPILKTYSVPMDRAEDVKNALNALFQGKDGGGGAGAQAFAGGLLAVKAPASLQEGVGPLIEKLANAVKDRPGLKIEYWLVVGADASASDFSAGDGAVRPALEAIAKAQGPKRFRVIDHLAFNSLDRQRVKLKSRLDFEARNTATSLEGRVFLETKLTSRLGEIEAQVELRPGEFVVLGQNSAPANRDAKRPMEDDLMNPPPRVDVYYVARAELRK